MPLTCRVTFKVQLQNHGRFQIPKRIRWFYKLESSQMLSVSLKVFHLGFEEKFLATMLADGRITIPRLVAVALEQRMPNHKASFVEVVLEPA